MALRSAGSGCGELLIGSVLPVYRRRLWVPTAFCPDPCSPTVARDRSPTPGSLRSLTHPPAANPLGSRRSSTPTHKYPDGIPPLGHDAVLPVDHADDDGRQLCTNR